LQGFWSMMRNMQEANTQEALNPGMDFLALIDEQTAAAMRRSSFHGPCDVVLPSVKMPEAEGMDWSASTIVVHLLEASAV
jgi:hypothetical protein